MTKTKTSRIGPKDLNYHGQPRGAAPVQFLINGVWVHKGWLMPTFGGENK